ncbi:TetR/AcrR family transcriptional regulator [Arthrobacter sp. 92]|jgi:AcrR family transcriptional regulator|uniref:TetR/AcrR family transcriptional regulator n=1 Tax=Arthrobacter sp. 92 TaxID=3418175 RepID=UPI0006A82F83|nr:transcriptional regulator protein [Arthrobacter sp. Hiyo6]
MTANDDTIAKLLPAQALTGREDPVDRILATAYELFSRRGIRDVGTNELIASSGVAKATFYRHFPSKDALVLAFLALRDQVWTVDLIVTEARRRGRTAEERLLAIFDVFGDWFQRPDFEACTFINVLLEMGPEHPLGRASIGYLGRIRGHIQALAEEAGLKDTEDFARSWHILMKGSIISATEGDFLASRRAQEMAGWLIEHHRH